MSKRILIFCVAVLALAVAMPVFAAVQNVKVSGDLSVAALDRYNFALGDTDVNSGGHQNLIYHIARLRVDAELTDNVSVVMRLLSEKYWDNETVSTTDVDLDLAYMTLKEFLYSPLTLTLGLQELHFGNDLIIGDVDTNALADAASAGLVTGAGGLTDLGDLSARKAFEAMRATLNYTVLDQPLAVDLVYSKIDENTNNREDDVNLYGANANYAVNNDILAEAYVWLRQRMPGSFTVAPIKAQGIKAEELVTIGGRGVYTGIENLTLQGEYAIQTGNKYLDTTTNPNLVTVADGAANPMGYRYEDDIVPANAWALQLIANYAFPDVRHTPALGLSYTHLSGEKNPLCSGPFGDWNAWDAMYENQAGVTIFNKILGYSNSDLINLKGSLKPDFVDDLTILANWYHIRVVEALATTPSAYILSGVAAGQSYIVTSDKHLGDELDLNLIYDYTEDVQLGLNLGWFVPGDAFDVRNKDAATQAIASMKVTF